MAVFNQIHEICFHGQGGYDWHTVYNMPIWLRLFTFNKMQEHYDAKNNANKKAAEESWLTGEARQAAAENKSREKTKTVKVPEFIRASKK